MTKNQTASGRPAIDHHDLAADLLAGVDHHGTAPALQVALALAHATLAVVEALTEVGCSPMESTVRPVDLTHAPAAPADHQEMDRP